MDWDRFHFLCRHYKAAPEGLLPGDGTDCLKKGELRALGAPLASRSLGVALLRRLQALPADTAQPLLTWYGDQDFGPILSPPPQVRGVMLYLSALSAVLGFMMFIYHLFVLPRLADFHASVEAPGSETASALVAQGNAFASIAIVLLLLVWLFAWQVRCLYQFQDHDGPRSLQWLPGGVGSRYRDLVALLCLPVTNAAGERPHTHVATEYLAYCGDLVPGSDLPILIRRKAEDLGRRVWLCFRVAIGLVGVSIALGVSLFLVGAYSPIFATGAML